MLHQLALSPAPALDERFTQGHRSALVALLRALDYSQATATELWDFAEEVGTMYRIGLTNADLRFLLKEGLIEHAEEVPPGTGGARRQFRRVEPVTFSGRSCFVLTEPGEEVARELSTTSNGGCPTSDGLDARLIPRWEPKLQELRLGNKLVKRFRRPAPNQELILLSFQEQQWPLRIDDPLPRKRDRDSLQCLHDTINHLNRARVQALIHFTGDGTGRGVRWELRVQLEGRDRHQSGT